MTGREEGGASAGAQPNLLASVTCGECHVLHAEEDALSQITSVIWLEFRTADFENCFFQAPQRT